MFTVVRPSQYTHSDVAPRFRIRVSQSRIRSCTSTEMQSWWRRWVGTAKMWKNVNVGMDVDLLRSR